MYLTHKASNKHVKAEIMPVEQGDWKLIRKDKRFEFDWRTEQHLEIYKLCLKDEGRMVGLISLQDIAEEFRIHVNLVECSSENVGKDKEYDRVAGCMLAFACKLAFDKSYGGFVSLTPKTRLIGHYMSKYGFRQFGRQLGMTFENSILLINQYFK